jgi:hypothetical protein
MSLLSPRTFQARKMLFIHQHGGLPSTNPHNTIGQHQCMLLLANVDAIVGPAQ